MRNNRLMALPRDELELVSNKLPFAPDYIRFRSVCKLWRSAAPKRPQIPWLITTNSRGSSYEINFYQFENNNFTRIPELSESPLLSSSLAENSAVRIGSSHGWLALLNPKTSSVSLCNPLTNSIIDLPNLQICHISCSSFCFSLTSDPGDSLSNCLAIMYWSKRVLYCKIGCSSGWTELAQHVSPDPHFCTYSGNVFFASGGDVFVCNLGSDPGIYKIVSLSLSDIEISGREFGYSYLVESDGDLLLLLVYFSFNFEDEDSSSSEDECFSCEYDNFFRVFKLEFGCHYTIVRLVELKSLGDKALFLKEETIFCLTANKYPGCKENSIYTSEIIYDFEAGSSMDINLHENVVWDQNRKQSFWFAPSLLT